VDARDAEKEPGNNARGDVCCGAGPLAVFQHLGGFPSEAGESGVAAEEADGDGHAPVRRNNHAIQRELADQAEKEAAGQIDEQGAVRKRAADADLHDALEAVAGERACRAENRDECKTQSCSDLPLAGRIREGPAPKTETPGDARPCDDGASCQESSAPTDIGGAVVANSIAFEIST